MDHPYTWLKYLPADDLDDQTVDFDGMKVESPSGDNMGKAEGFIVDSDSGRPYYVVVDAGGWFKSRHFLLPVGHVRLDADTKALTADVPKERVERFPGFDLGKFDKMSVDDLKRLNVETLQACTVAGVVYAYSDTEPYTAAWDRADFSYPSWWTGQHPSERKSEMSGGKAEVGSGMRPVAASYDRSGGQGEKVIAQGSESNNVRAQPGDVIGLDTDGEQTHIGETAEDEDKRREAAEEEAKKLRGREGR